MPNDKGWEEERSEIRARFRSQMDKPLRIQLSATRSHCMEITLVDFPALCPLRKIMKNRLQSWSVWFLGKPVVLANVLHSKQSVARSEPLQPCKWHVYSEEKLEPHTISMDAYTAWKLSDYGFWMIYPTIFPCLILEAKHKTAHHSNVTGQNTTFWNSCCALPTCHKKVVRY